jgi:hypothetical protein
LKLGTLAKGLGNGVFFCVLANQLVNLYFRGKPTWENPEDDHKWDAYIPVGKGLWISPLSTVAEVTHGMVAGSRQGGLMHAAAQTFENKLSPLGRVADTFAHHENYKGERLLTSGQVLAEMGKNLVPTPLPLSGFVSKNPDQKYRSLLSSIGIKTDPVSAETKMEEAAQKRFGKGLEQTDLRERAELSREREKQEKSPLERMAATERVVEQEVKNLYEVEKNMKPDTMAWLKTQKLSLPSFEEALGGTKNPIYLSKGERERFMGLIVSSYETLIDRVKERIAEEPDQQKRQLMLNKVLDEARVRARLTMQRSLGSPSLLPQ